MIPFLVSNSIKVSTERNLTYVSGICFTLALVFLEDSEFFQTLASFNSLLKFAFLLAVLPVFVQDLEKVL